MELRYTLQPRIPYLGIGNVNFGSSRSLNRASLSRSGSLHEKPRLAGLHRFFVARAPLACSKGQSYDKRPIEVRVFARSQMLRDRFLLWRRHSLIASPA
jgi:hypothetical protein